MAWTEFGFDAGPAATAQPSWGDGPQQAKRLGPAALWTGFGAVVLIALVVGVSVWSASGSSDQGLVQGARTTQHVRTGTLDDWLTAICKPGSLLDAQSFPGAVTSGACIGAREPVLVFYGKYASNFRIDNDLVEWPHSAVAKLAVEDGTTWVFLAQHIPPDAAGMGPRSDPLRDLAALRDFGFNVRMD